MNAPASAVELLQTLIRIPSVNPQGDPGTGEVGEKRIAEWLAEYLESLGASVELREVLPGRPNVVARFPGGHPGKPRLLLAPHTDTVSVAGMTIEPFAGELRDGRVWGRGASDTKGSMAAMLWALHTLRDRLPASSHEVWFAGLMSEEAIQHGSKALAREERFDFVIAGEPTGLDVVYTHKGSAFLQLRTRGRSGHGARPELGENAILKMLDVLDLIRRELSAEFATLHDPVLGSPTINLGTIAGGSNTNIIPEACEATVDLRFIPAQWIPGFAEALASRLRSVCPDLDLTLSPAPPLKSDPSHPLIRKLGEYGARPVGAPWFCDACFFAEQGMPAIALGPGSIVQAHTQDEWIAVEDLENGVALFQRFLRDL
ncbi:MAG: M20 family metallopeptidase [Verrucomicrobiota bacterium]|nr:M20 family metallopeptidase [Verrucomicrobiota bacterium]